MAAQFINAHSATSVKMEIVKFTNQADAQPSTNAKPA